MENAVDANAQHHEGKFCQLTSLFLAEICDRFEGKMCEEGGQRWNLPKRSNVGKRKRKRGKEGRSWLASWTLSLPGSTNTMRAEIQCNQIFLFQIFQNLHFFSLISHKVYSMKERRRRWIKSESNLKHLKSTKLSLI